jgi:hypothetical protein
LEPRKSNRLQQDNIRSGIVKTSKSINPFSSFVSFAVTYLVLPFKIHPSSSEKLEISGKAFLENMLFQ